MKMELKEKEERKRDAAYDPVQRWIHIQQTITWAEANLPPHLRRNRPRTRRDVLGKGDAPHSYIVEKHSP
jgi:hypothetical protein